MIIHSFLKRELKEILENRFNSIVIYNYEIEYSCSDSGCVSDWICRCGRIYDARVTHVDLIRMSEQIYDFIMNPMTKSGKRNSKIDTIFYGGRQIDIYCINRIVTKYKIFNPDVWTVGVVGGYYGDEIGDVYLDKITFNLIIELCEKVLSFDNLSDKIKYVLSIEYGYLLDDIYNSEFDLIEIDKSDIDFSALNKNYISNIEKSLPLKHNNYIFYGDDYNLPRGIVRKFGNKYKIVDGYHRILSAGDDKFKVFISFHP